MFCMDEKLSVRSRALPAQIAVRLICGERFTDVAHTPEALTDRIRSGRDFLVSITGRDFGYDLAAWHDYLKESRDGGYTWGRNIRLPKIMQHALESPEWRQAVQQLTQE
jgi:hypothetical protein